MKEILGFFVILAAFSVASASASDQMRVNASRDLRMAVVDSSKQGAERYAIHCAFSASLSAALTQQYGSSTNVRFSDVDADHAASDLAHGDCDAVLVSSESLPQTFVRPDFNTVRAVSQIGVPARVFYLVMADGDQSFHRKLSNSFESALSSPPLLRALTRAVAVRVSAND